MRARNSGFPWRASLGIGFAGASVFLLFRLLEDPGNLRADPLVLMVLWAYLALAATLWLRDEGRRSPGRIALLAVAAVGATWVFDVRTSPDPLTSVVGLAALFFIGVFIEYL